jgi:hypothetical protein
MEGELKIIWKEKMHNVDSDDLTQVHELVVSEEIVERILQLNKRKKLRHLSVPQLCQDLLDDVVDVWLEDEAYQED